MDRLSDRPKRRVFLERATAIAAASLLGIDSCPAADESVLETNRIRLAYGPFICYAPMYIAEALLRAEGFTEIEFTRYSESYVDYLANRHSDLAIFGSPQAVAAIDDGKPIVMIAGVHAGCWELFVHEHVGALRDFKGRRVAVLGKRTADYLWIASLCAYVGMDPRDIDWVVSGSLAASQKMFEENKVEAFLAFPPQPQELRIKRIGRPIVNTTLDKPWSRYFCCLVGSTHEYTRANPVATKRALRALLKAADICAKEPHKVAKFMADKGYEPRYEIGREVLNSLPYSHWREWAPDESLRFHALRLHEVAMIKATPQQIIDAGTNWRFLEELKR